MIAAEPRIVCPRARHVACARGGLFAAALALLVGCDLPERPPDWRETAAELGMETRVELPLELRQAFAQLPSIERRPQNFFPEVMIGDDVVLMDWVWRDGRLKDREREAQTVFAFRRPGETIPAFVLARRGSLEVAEQRALGGSLDWPDDTAFADAVAVAGRDRAGIRAFLTPARRAALTESAEWPPEWRLEGAGEWIAVFRPNVRLPPARLPVALDEARALVTPLQGGD